MRIKNVTCATLAFLFLALGFDPAARLSLSSDSGVVARAEQGTNRPATESRMTSQSLIRQFYETFQRAEFTQWDEMIADDVLLNSPAGLGVRGLKAFKEFARQFTDLGYRIDLIDEHLALDANGNGRGFITFLLHWKHTREFGGLAPTGREGTSLETILFTIQNQKITRMLVGDNSLD